MNKPIVVGMIGLVGSGKSTVAATMARCSILTTLRQSSAQR